MLKIVKHQIKNKEYPLKYKREQTKESNLKNK